MPLELTCLVGASSFAAGWLGRRWFPSVGAPTERCFRGSVAGSLHRRLCEDLQGTSAGPYLKLCTSMKEDHSYPHTNVPGDVLYSLFERLRPRFLVEVGSFKGGSSIRIVSALLRLELAQVEVKPCLVCIDTFLGDAAMWLNKQATGRSSLLLKDGCPQLYMQFMVNTAKYADIIVPFPIASLCGLRALQLLAADGRTPLVDFLYLDSAHLKGETKLEITEAFKLVRPGGILLGDDLDWPAVEADLSSFLADHAESTSQSADDALLNALPGAFFFAAGGYWVVEAQPRQWMLRKPTSQGTSPGSQKTLEAAREELKAEILAAEMCEKPAEFVAATDEDQEAMAVYQQGIAKLEMGDTAEGSRLLKVAAKMSPSLEYHFLLR